MTGERDETQEELARRVLAARGRSVVEPTSGVAWALPKKVSWAMVVALVIGTVLVLLVLRRGAELPPMSGSVEARERTEIKLGHRGRAVLEAGAAIDWAIVAGGAITVEHRAGTVFYRSQGLSPFVVRGRFGRLSPHQGTASFTLGTSLRVHQGRLRLSCAARETLLEPGISRALPGCAEPQ